MFDIYIKCSIVVLKKKKIFYAINNHQFSTDFPVFPDYDKERNAGVTGQQMMRTPPWHLVRPLFCLCFAPVLYVFFWTFDLEHIISFQELCIPPGAPIFALRITG